MIREFDATIVGSDPGTDIAVLQIEDPENLVEMKIGDSRQTCGVATSCWPSATRSACSTPSPRASSAPKAAAGIKQDGYERHHSDRRVD